MGISICELLSHYHKSAHLYSNDAPSDLTALALSVNRYSGSPGTAALGVCFYFLKTAVRFDSRVPPR